MDIIAYNLVRELERARDPAGEVLLDVATRGEMLNTASRINTEGKYGGKLAVTPDGSRLFWASGPLPTDTWEEVMPNNPVLQRAIIEEMLGDNLGALEGLLDVNTGWAVFSSQWGVVEKARVRYNLSRQVELQFDAAVWTGSQSLADVAAFSLPTGYRPPKRLRIAEVACFAGSEDYSVVCNARIEPSGDVFLEVSPSSLYEDITGLTIHTVFSTT